MSDWNDREPIYVQLRHKVLRSIMSGALIEGEAVPSVRQVASSEQINPITVSKAYQMLVDEGLLEKRRGLGMFVTAGAQQVALERERAHFLAEEWPLIQARIRDLDLDAAALFEGKD